MLRCSLLMMLGCLLLTQSLQARPNFSSDCVDLSDLPQFELPSKLRGDDFKRANLRIQGVTLADSDTIEKLQGAMVLSLEAQEFDELPLGFITKLPLLRILRLSGFDFQQLGDVTDILKGSSLEVLELQDCWMRGETVSELLRCPSLRKLGFQETTIVEGAVQCDLGVSKLTTLSLQGTTGLGDLDLDWISHITTLEWLDLSGFLSAPQKMKKVIGQLTALQYLSVAFTDADDSFIARAISLPNLQTLDLFGCSNFTGQTISPPKVETLRVGGRLMPTEQWSWISKCSSVKSLRVDFHSFTHDSWGMLNKLSGLDELVFFGCETEIEAHFDTLGCKELKRLGVFGDPTLTDARLAKWVNQVELEELTLNECEAISDSTLIKLADSSLLKISIKWLPKVTEKGIRALSKFAKLDVVEIGYLPGATGESIVQLVTNSKARQFTIWGMELKEPQLDALSKVEPPRVVTVHQ